MQKLIGGCQIDSSVGNAHARNLRDINKFQQNKKKNNKQKKPMSNGCFKISPDNYIVWQK